MSRFEPDGFPRFRMLITALVMTILWGGPPLPSHARGLDEIKASGELRFCIAPVGPASASPLNPACREDCGFSGPVYREAMAFAGHLGNTVRPVFHRVEWDEQFHDRTGHTDRGAVYTPHLLATGKCDVYPSHVTRNEWRSKKLDFAILFPSRMLVMVKQSRSGAMKTPADLAGATAAAEKNSSFHTWLTEQNETTFARDPIAIRLMSLKEGLKAVENGEADFTLVDADIALWEASHSFSHLRVAFPVGPKDEIGWAFDKKDQNLRNGVQDFFDSQARDEASELNKIWKEEFGVTLIQFQSLIQATK